MRELRNTKIIAVDHGYGNMKTADTNLPSYMMFPRFLLDMEINETAKMLYIILLDRARLAFVDSYSNSSNSSHLLPSIR